MKKYDYITPPNNFLDIPVRFLSSIIVRKIAKSSITPNQITFFRGLILYPIILYLFTLGNYRCYIFAFIIFQISELLDHIDGDLARYKNMCSKLGKSLEVIFDCLGTQVSNIFGLCVTIGIYRHTLNYSIFFVFISITLARLIWVELREPFMQWHNKKSKIDTHAGKSMSSYLENRLIPEKKRLLHKISKLFFAVFIWRNQIILWGALFFYPLEKYLHINSLFWAMIIVAILNNFIWIACVINGFSEKQKFDQKG